MNAAGTPIPGLTWVGAPYASCVKDMNLASFGTFIEPETLTTKSFATTFKSASSGGLPGEMLLAFLVCLVGMALLWTTLVWFELDSKAASGDLKRIRRALEASA